MSKFVPSLIVDTIYDIDFEYLRGKGILGVIFDLDNTIAGYKQVMPCEKLVAWLETLKDAGFSVVIVSNNKKDRVERFNRDLKLPCIYEAKKPLLKSFAGARDILQLPPENIAVVGDQIFTDVFGGNRMGMTTILVSPLESSENVFFRLKRLLETPFIRSYHRRAKGGKQH